MSNRKFVNRSLLAYAIVMIAVGIMLLFGGVNAANQIMGIIVTLIGVVLIALGIVSILSKNLPYGIVLLAVGILVVIFAWTLAYIAFILLGVLLFAYGLDDLIKKRGSIASNLIALLIGISIILLACGSRFSWQFLNILFYIAGALTLVDGIILLVESFR